MILDISLAVTATSVSVYLEVNMTYSVSLHVESCRGGVNSSEYTVSTDDLNCTTGIAFSHNLIQLLEERVLMLDY